MEKRLKLATWNLQRPAKSLTRRSQAIVEWINQIAADIWVLTETHDSISPGSEYSGISTHGADRIGDPGEKWVTIWSKFPIEPIPTSDTIRTVAARIVHPNAPFKVYGTVLPWVGSPWRNHSSTGGTAFREALKVQLADWIALQKVKPNETTFVLGDFNQDLANAHYYGSKINRNALEKALSRAGLVALTAGDQDPIWQNSAPHACIDHICMSLDSRWISDKPTRWPNRPQPEKRISDHFGLSVELRHEA